MNDKTGLTENEIALGIKVTEYFYNKYGLKKCKFIMSRIATGVKKYSYNDLTEIGEKIALFNGWTNMAELNKIGIK